MKQYYYYLILAFLVLSSGAIAQVSLNPTVSPSIFTPNDEITVTYDVTGTSLASLGNAYIWVWIPGQNTDAKYNINPASTNTSLTNNAKFTKLTADGKTTFSITFIPKNFFDGDITSAVSIGMLLKGNDWSNGQTTDYITEFWDGNYTLKLNSPAQLPLFVDLNDQIHIDAEVPVASTIQLFVNEELVDEVSGATTYVYDYTVEQSSGYGTIKLVATAGSTSESNEFQFILSASSPLEARPAGIIPGINYGGDHSKVIVCLWAPEKSSVYVRGDFSEWAVLPENLMKRDGEFFWLEIAGLTAGTEYGFQYLVDEEIYLADPYADKILDPDDQYIPETVYPSLKTFPAEAMSNRWYFNRVAVFQTNQTPYVWQATNYERPDEKNLVVYELLIRDFFGENERTYENLTDTIEYFKRLGVNAIELMPIMEFNGNESWGYNPAFMFAPDKYYGPKNKLKEFVDHCHAEGIAVILDIAMNHQDLPNSYVLMDFDFVTGKPRATNKWFNVTAKHPFNVFFDMNHESSYTKAYLDTINHYWLNEYKVDGFRFDLSKGFTQKNNPNDVGAWSAYDESRIAILKRMADEIWSHTPDAIIILEHLAVNDEEKELAEYRADEGLGMMLWGNMNHSYRQLAMGYETESDISGTSYKARSWTVPHLVSYMESHDEERLGYSNKQFGNTIGAYSVKDKATSMERIGAASVIFYSVPGPKMLWQFGELGYDYSINTCPDGSVSDGCRVSPKPVKWEYFSDSDRLGLFILTSDLIKMHTTYSVFTNGTATVTTGSSYVKQVQLKNNPYTDTPAASNEMNVQAVANFGMSSTPVSVTFAHTGTWYDYYNGGEPLNVTSTPFQITLQRGEYRLFTDVEIGPGPITSNEELVEHADSFAYPNPTEGLLTLETRGIKILKLYDSRGLELAFRREGNVIDISDVPEGLYILLCQDTSGTRNVMKILKK
jgi:1,4-alpha-glucan branching enzyme